MRPSLLFLVFRERSACVCVCVACMCSRSRVLAQYCRPAKDPGHLDQSKTNNEDFLFGIPCEGGATFAELVCIKCPKADVDVVFLVDVGDSMIDKLKQVPK